MIRLPFNLISCAIAISAVVSPCHSASYDCKSASNFTEKLVCSNPQLSKADELLNRYYKMAISSSEDENGIRISQLQWLDERNNCIDKLCVETAYKQRIRQLFSLLKNDADKKHKLLPGNDKVSRVCALVANEEARHFLVESGGNVADVNNDQLDDAGISCPSPDTCPRYTDADGNDVTPGHSGFEYKTFWPESVSIFRFENSTYMLAKGGGQPAYVSYVAPNNMEYMLCSFDYSTSKKVRPNSSTCRDFVVDFKKLNYVTHFEGVSSYVVFEDRPESRVKSIGLIDYDNDGTDEHIAEISYTTGRGYGSCPYYELIDKEDLSVKKGKKRQLLMMLQGVELNERGVPRCIGAGRFVKNQGGKTLFEISRHPEPNIVRILENDDIKDVCSIVEKEYVNVDKYYPFGQ